MQSEVNKQKLTAIRLWRPDDHGAPAVVWRLAHLRLAFALLLLITGSLGVISLLNLRADAELGATKPWYSPASDIFDSVSGRLSSFSRPSKSENRWKYDKSDVLKGAPTDKFRDNLKDDVKYITTFLGYGHTNDFMSYMNIIYIATLCHRVPIIGPFRPSHIGKEWDVGYFPFGDVYDLPRLSEEIVLPIVEWRDVKKRVNEETRPEPVGGWTAFAAVDDKRHKGLPFPNFNMSLALGLDISYTKVPSTTRVSTIDPFMSMIQLARLGTRQGHLRGVAENPNPFESEGPLKVRKEPDRQVLIIDQVYWGAILNSWEWNDEFYEPWRIAYHCHFHPKMKALAHQYLMREFGVRTVEEIPKYIGVHVRHGDYAKRCAEKHLELADCWAPLERYQARVDEIQAELDLRRERVLPDGSKMKKLEVLMFTNEVDPVWRENARQMGWHSIDHDELQTADKLGIWYPLLIDTVMQSMSHGYVGTEWSTMSDLARRRVEFWQQGPTRSVQWGENMEAYTPKKMTSRELFINNRYY